MPIAFLVVLGLAAMAVFDSSSQAPIQSTPIAGSVVSIITSGPGAGHTILTALPNSHSPTGYSNGAGWAVNPDGSIFYDSHYDRVVA